MRKITAAIAALSLSALSFASLPMSASAEPDPAASTRSYTFDKYLVMEPDANVPNVSFDFTVRPATAAELTGDAKIGPAGIAFTTTTGVTLDSTDSKIATVSFTNSDTKVVEANKGQKTIDFVTTDDTTDEQFVAKELTLDLSNITFTDPGVYRYIITEDIADSLAGISYDTDNTRILDVYVTNPSTGLGDNSNFVVKGYMYPSNVTIDTTTEKSTGFTNKYTTNNLTFRKTVTGNQGSKNKFFKIKVQFTKADGLDINDSDVFAVGGSFTKEPVANDITIYSVADMAANNVTSLTYAQLSAGYSFYLQSGQSVELTGIPSGLGYVITEYQEEYTPSVALTGDNKTDDAAGEGTAISGASSAPSSGAVASNTYSVTDSYLKNDATVSFTNEREGTIPTGVIAAVGGALALLAVGAAGIAAGTYCLKKKKSEEE